MRLPIIGASVKCGYVITFANVLIYSCSLPYISHQIGKGGVVSAAIEIVTRVSSHLSLMPFIIIIV